MRRMRSLILQITKKAKAWKIEHESQLKEFRFTLHLIRRNPLSFIGITILLILILLAIFAPIIAPYPGDIIETHASERLQAPSWKHLMGTDDLGRDILSRIIFGTRASLKIAIIVLLIAASIGIILGSIAGYIDAVDDLIMRITDMFLSFPSLLLAMAIAAALGPSITNVMIAIAITWWPWYARLVRGQILSLKEQPFILAAKALGLSRKRIIFRHLLPNSFGAILIAMSMDAGFVILTAAGLGFIGLGAQPPTPEWGLMISTGRSFMPQFWWYATFPGIAIMITVFAFNLIGDALRDIMDPRLRR